MKQLMVISLLVFGWVLSAFSSEEVFSSANEDYRSENFAEAIQKYESLLSTAPSAQVYYNLGNAYYKTGNFTLAILNYERALKLDPTDEDIRHNLDIANLSTTDKIDATPEFFLLTWWKALSLKLRSDTWSIVFLCVLWLSIISFLAFAFLNTPFRKFLLLSGMGGTFVALVILLLAVTRHNFETNDDTAIITAPSVSVKSAPLTSGTDIFIIHEGLKVQIIDNENDWLKICLPDDKQGWIPSQMAEAI